MYQRQGRIGTYAIFWNHEAIQAGATYRAHRRRLDLPVATARSRSALSAACRRRRSCTGGAVTRPAGGAPPTGTSGRSWCRSRRISRMLPAWRGGSACEGSRRRCGRVLRRRRDERRRVPRRREPRRSDRCAGRVRLQQQPVGDLDAALGPDARRVARRQGGRLRHPGVRVDGLDVLAVYEATRDAVERARAGDGPTLHRGRALPRGAARDRRRSSRLHRPGPRSRRSARTSASAATTRSRRSGVLTDEFAAAVKGRSRGSDARGHRCRRGYAAARSRAAVLERVRRPAGKHARWLS